MVPGSIPGGWMCLTVLSSSLACGSLPGPTLAAAPYCHQVCSSQDAVGPGSSIGFFGGVDTGLQGQHQGLFWELNPGPPAPEAGIMPLDQTAS